MRSRGFAKWPDEPIFDRSRMSFRNLKFWSFGNYTTTASDHVTSNSSRTRDMAEDLNYTQRRVINDKMQTLFIKWKQIQDGSSYFRFLLAWDLWVLWTWINKSTKRTVEFVRRIGERFFRKKLNVYKPLMDYPSFAGIGAFENSTRQIRGYGDVPQVQNVSTCNNCTTTNNKYWSTHLNSLVYDYDNDQPYSRLS